MKKYRNKQNDTIVTAFQIPDYDQDPPEGMVEWLHENPKEWEGDSSGILMDGCFYGCGDWMLRSEYGFSYWGMSRETFERLYELTT